MAAKKSTATACKSPATKPKPRAAAAPVGKAPVIYLAGAGLREMSVRVYGTKPLVVHRIGGKYAIYKLMQAQGILPKQAQTAKDPIGTFLDSIYSTTREDRPRAIDAEGKVVTKYVPEDCEEGLQPIWAQFPDGTFDRFVFPAHSLREAMGTASFATKITKDIVTIRRALNVSRLMLPIETPREPQMRFDVAFVRGQADLRYRAQFDEWALRFVFRYSEAIASAETLLNILKLAGVSIGIGEMRPEKKIGAFGQFEIDTTSITDAAL